MLYLVPTPIGNLGDITPRALACLESVDFIAAEDTRVTIKLLNHFEIKKSMVPYHRHNTETGGRQILQRLLQGEDCALVTDAGCPAISDPGEELVVQCVEAGIEVTALTGACALTTALSVSGLPTGRFTFEGFLATNKKNRRRHLAELEKEVRTMMFYEAPHKLTGTLSDFRDCFGGERRIALCRELTKKHEEVLRFTLEEAVAYYEEEKPRGEFVLVLEGAVLEEEKAPSLEDGVALVEEAVALGESFSSAVKRIAKEGGFSRNQLYQAGKEGISVENSND